MTVSVFARSGIQVTAAGQRSEAWIKGCRPDAASLMPKRRWPGTGMTTGLVSFSG